MRSGFRAEHWKDENGNPAGGSTFGTGFAISWQHGPLGRPPDRREPNGAFVEDVLAAVQDRLEHYQSTAFACPENAAAYCHINTALDVLRSRTKDREERGVEGTHQA